LNQSSSPFQGKTVTTIVFQTTQKPFGAFVLFAQYLAYKEADATAQQSVLRCISCNLLPGNRYTIYYRCVISNSMYDEDFQTSQDDVIMYPSNRRRNLKLLAVLVLVGIVGVGGWLLYIQLTSVPTVTITDAAPSDLPPSSFEETITSVGPDYVFELRYAPDATTRIMLDTPTIETNAADIADYNERVSESGLINPEFAARDTAFNLMFENGEIFADYVLTQGQVAVLYQLHDELLFLASEFDNKTELAPLHEQIETAELLTPIKPNPFPGNNEVVFPSQRAVSGFYVAEIMALADPDNAELYRADSQLFAERGILYGQYGISSVNAAKSLVEQYFQLVIENNPELLTTLIN